ncbi:aminoglycoside phosphotransferase family protein [Rhodococcus jostii]|uniref:aminoglycoside phosphotransferase family protein n=1 Tax=Rhodococcus jostii TaxID=132919 RepID=UPI00059F688D|nr:aminoglycoside phosphotransferase family protein [Rhodococcus jostii]
MYADVGEKLLVTEYLPGELVEGSPADWDPATYLQAGQALAGLLLPGDVSAVYYANLIERTHGYIDRAEDLVSADQLEALRVRLAATAARPVRLSFTHGDHHPRNWLLHESELRVIDFGRADWRHWTSDLVRLQSQQFMGRPDLEEAFLAGLGRDLTASDVETLDLEWMHQAIATVVWAHNMGDAEFEEHCRWMLDKSVGPGIPGSSLKT